MPAVRPDGSTAGAEPLGAAARDVTSRMLGVRVLVPREKEEEARALLESDAIDPTDPGIG